MTQTSIAQPLDTSHYLMLTPGEVRTFARGGITVKLFAVAGGSFTRLDVRDAKGGIFVERSGTYQFEGHAILAYVAVVRWMLAQDFEA